MTYSLQLRVLGADIAAAPFGFDEFERRRACLRHQNRAAGWSAAAALGVLALVPLVAVLTQGKPATTLMPGAAAPAPVVEVFTQPPALVDMDRFAATSELEDHIALLDAEISAARLRPVSEEDVRRMEIVRRQLTDSLQGVAYAHALLDL